MFYFYAEKQKSTFYESWELRQVAIDTTRRYLYYSDAIPKELRQSQFGKPASGKMGVDPKLLKYERKLKVFRFEIVAAGKSFDSSSDRHTEQDFYQVDIYGEPRTMVSGERPSMNLLNEDSGPFWDSDRYTYMSDDYVRDPYTHRFLFESLRAQYKEMAAAKKQAHRQRQLSEKTKNDEPLTPTVTYKSPGTRALTLKEIFVGGRLTCVRLRCLSEISLHRLWFLLLTMLGADFLLPKPYKALPAFDPRNGIYYGHIPMNIYKTFAKMDDKIYYCFIKGDLLGSGAASTRNSVTSSPVSSGEGSKSFRDAARSLQRLHADVYCVINHDLIYFYTAAGRCVMWLRLRDTTECFYNYKCSEPFVAFVSDRPAPDCLFVPKHPRFGKDLVQMYDARFEVRRLQRIIHDVCYASLTARRLGVLHEVEDANAAAFVKRLADSPKPLLLLPSREGATAGQSGGPPPFPNETLQAAWMEISDYVRHQAEAQAAQEAEAAIPLQTIFSERGTLTPQQMRAIERQLDDDRVREDEVVGMPFARLQNLAESRGAHLGVDDPSLESNDSTSFNSTDGGYEYTNGDYYTAEDLARLAASSTGAASDIMLPATTTADAAENTSTSNGAAYRDCANLIPNSAAETMSEKADAATNRSANERQQLAVDADVTDEATLSECKPSGTPH